MLLRLWFGLLRLWFQSGAPVTKYLKRGSGELRSSFRLVAVFPFWIYGHAQRHRSSENQPQAAAGSNNHQHAATVSFRQQQAATGSCKQLPSTTVNTNQLHTPRQHRWPSAETVQHCSRLGRTTPQHCARLWRFLAVQIHMHDDIHVYVYIRIYVHI